MLTFILLLFSKSTFFNTLTKSQANAENFPFCTIDPNESKYTIDHA
jgi:ribosome-binding ATPase YchF (GTP1/OBG family)